MEATCTVPSPVDVPAQLSSAQKRDLLGQACAAVITMALMVFPFVASPADSADGMLPAQSFAGAAPVVALADRHVAPLSRAVVPARPRATARLMASAVPAIAMQPQVVETSGYMRGLESASLRSAPRRPLSRKLTGWLTGDGTHTVRPFPTIGSSRP